MILSKVTGAGEVEVLLTVSAGEETIYQTDCQTDSSGDSENRHCDTVMITDANRNETGLVRQIFPATYQGAIIVCRGADSPAVRFAIVEAVSKLTGLSSNQISVLKMK